MARALLSEARRHDDQGVAGAAIALFNRSVRISARVERAGSGGQFGPATRAAAAPSALSLLAVNLVKLGPFLDVRQEHRALHHLFHGTTATFDDGFEVIDPQPK